MAVAIYFDSTLTFFLWQVFGQMLMGVAIGHWHFTLKTLCLWTSTFLGTFFLPVCFSGVCHSAQLCCASGFSSRKVLLSGFMETLGTEFKELTHRVTIIQTENLEIGPLTVQLWQLNILHQNLWLNYRSSISDMYDWRLLSRFRTLLELVLFLPEFSPNWAIFRQTDRTKGVNRLRNQPNCFVRVVDASSKNGTVCVCGGGVGVWCVCVCVSVRCGGVRGWDKNMNDTTSLDLRFEVSPSPSDAPLLQVRTAEFKSAVNFFEVKYPNLI
jgi:hypothetical protein